MSVPARAIPVRTHRGTRATRRPALRLVQPHAAGAPRTPFVLLVLALLGSGLVALLLINAAGVAASNREQSLRDDTTALQLREQQLTREVSSLEAPGALAEAARKLGMVASGPPAFLVLEPDGSSRVVGEPTPAAADPDAAGGAP